MPPALRDWEPWELCLLGTLDAQVLAFMMHVYICRIILLFSCSCDAVPVTRSSEQQFKLVLSQSPLYPEGGGQPGDRGRLSFPDGKLLVR